MSNLFYLACIRLLISSRAGTNHACATFNELPFNISTMGKALWNWAGDQRFLGIVMRTKYDSNNTACTFKLLHTVHKICWEYMCRNTNKSFWFIFCMCPDVHFNYINGQFMNEHIILSKWMFKIIHLSVF